jgi:adenylosuccinate lyase
VERLEEQMRLPLLYSFANLVLGNYNAHMWLSTNRLEKIWNFVEENLGLHHSFPTTQIEHTITLQHFLML